MYTPEELQLGVDLENLLDMSATLFIAHNETEERTYANIESILPFKNEKRSRCTLRSETVWAVHPRH